MLCHLQNGRQMLIGQYIGHQVYLGKDYPAPELPRRGGGCISKYKSLTDVEMLVLEAKQKPGPADYADAYNKPNLQ